MSHYVTGNVSSDLSWHVTGTVSPSLLPGHTRVTCPSCPCTRIMSHSANWTETPGRLRHAVFYEFYITWQSDNGQLRPAYQALFPHPISPPLLDAMCVIPGYHLLLPSHSVQGILSALSRHTCSVRPGHTLATPLPQTVLILSQTHSTLRSDLWQEEATVSERGARGKEQMQNNVGMF